MPFRARGFTIIEVIVAVSLLAILTTIAVPAMGGVLRNSRVRSVSFDLRAALVRARSEAINRNTEVRVIPNGGQWSNGWTVQTAGGTQIEQSPPLPEVTITPAAAPTIVYRIDGRVSAGSQRIVVSLDGSEVQPRCITLGPSGLPSTRLDRNFEAADGCS
jgi:type IV fimbrial biogenesis protein FimT